MFMTETKREPIEALCDQLDKAFREDPRGKAVAGLLEAYAREHSDWEGFRHFQEGAYTRNLVRRTEDYELLLLCWGAGEESPIHNHMGQRCWMSILEGEVEEVHYKRQQDGAGPLIEGPTKRYKPGQAAFINDDIALHLVRGADGLAASSLHVYSKPYDVCLVYDPESGEESARALSYHSVDGVICGAEGSV